MHAQLRARIATTLFAATSSIVPLHAQSKTTLASTALGSASGSGGSSQSSLSSDGRWVAFASEAADLVANDTNARRDVFVRDRELGVTRRVNVTSLGVQSSSQAYFPTLSGNGRFVAFQSFASDLVAGDTNTLEDMFVHDLANNTTSCATVDSNGVIGSGGPMGPLFPFEPAGALSHDGRRIVYSSAFTSLVPNDTNNAPDIFLRDFAAGTTTRVSVSSSGAQGDAGSRWPAISADGRFVAFQSSASNLVAGDTNARRDVFVVDVASGAIELVSRSSAGLLPNQDCERPALSDDGRRIVFSSYADNLVSGDSNGHFDVFVRDRATNTTTRLSTPVFGLESDGNSHAAVISSNGRFAAFWSLATNLIATDINGRADVFVRDIDLGTTVRASLNEFDFGAQSNCTAPSLASDGRWVAFETFGALTSLDLNGEMDVYVRDLASAVPATACRGKLNSAGCVARISFVGTPQSSGVNPFDVRASDVLNRKLGLLFYGTRSAAVPYQGGTLCVTMPLRRTLAQNSGGTALPAIDCSGSLTFDFNAWIRSGADATLAAGSVVHCQYWHRDGAWPVGQQSGFSDAGFFEIAP